MSVDSGERDWDRIRDEPARETIKHAHPTLPFVEITEERSAGERTADDGRFEDWGFLISGPEGESAYDSVAYMRDDRTEQEMIADLAARAEKWLLDERGPFFVLWTYFATGQYRHEIDAVMRKHGQSPAWRRAEPYATDAAKAISTLKQWHQKLAAIILHLAEKTSGCR
jgi:hypothetical protein